MAYGLGEKRRLTSPLYLDLLVPFIVFSKVTPRQTVIAGLQIRNTNRAEFLANLLYF
jgi:hypothetical protein